MRFETSNDKRTIQRWCRLAIQLNGAADTGQYDHVSVPVVVKAARAGEVFTLLERELPPQVWTIAKLTDVDRHQLSGAWKLAAEGFEASQYHVQRNGLSLLVAYVLSLIDMAHTIVPT